MAIENIKPDFVPENLTEEEKKIWSAVAPKLIELEILNELNYLVLIRYCTLFIQTQNVIKKTPTHNAIYNLNKQLKLIEEELCLTPATLNKFQKDKLIIEDRKRKNEKYNKKTEDLDKEKFFT
jgi:phage terminase small subunit